MFISLVTKTPSRVFRLAAYNKERPDSLEKLLQSQYIESAMCISCPTINLTLL